MTIEAKPGSNMTEKKLRFIVAQEMVLALGAILPKAIDEIKKRLKPSCVFFLLYHGGHLDA
ncbi:MAG: hypothetical protein HW402_15 [Dehalococcoidales bacterium]|nr:hypothetical protein [Dehalococcoidales bacterium]